MSDNESCPVGHIACKHMWTDDEIFQYRELSNTTDGYTEDTQQEAEYAATDTARDMEKIIDAKRKTEMIVINAFQRLNNEMRIVYKELDRKMKHVLIEAESVCDDVIDGPRHDLTELLSTILSPSFDVREHATHEMFHLTHTLKGTIDTV